MRFADILRGVTILLLLLGSAGRGRAQPVLVIDPPAISAALKNLSALQQQLQQLQSLVTISQGLANAVGQVGNPATILQSGLSQDGLASFAAQINNSLTGAANPTLQSVLLQFGQAKGTSLSGQPDFSNFTGARQWVTQSLTNLPSDSSSAKALGRQARGLVASEMAADGYALALSARQQIAQMAARAQSLANQIGSSPDLRGDIESNSAVMLAIHDEMAAIQSLLAALLALQSSQQLVMGDDNSGLTAGAASH